MAAGCAACAAVTPWRAAAQAWDAPPRFTRPEITSDEGGLWALMDREETRLRRSPFALRDAQLVAYVQDIACRLAEAHCPDLRVHLVKTPYFNASMAPNGMMQIWTGLMLRVDNEAQLAAVIGHEIGHYLQRHAVDRLRDVKSRSAFASFLGMFGLVGAIGQMGLVAGMFAYGREHEAEADRIGALLMRRAGYDVSEAARVWENLQLEVKARGENAPSSSPMFATHPAPDDRMKALTELAEANPGGETGEAPWREKVRPYLRDWLAEEVKRGQHEESIALLTRMVKTMPARPEYLFSRAEVYRLRAKDNDLDVAQADYERAVALGGEPAETHRGLGYIYRTRNRVPEARSAFQRYLELAPEAPDSRMIKSYMEDLKT